MLKLRPYRPADAAAIVSWIADEYAFRQWCADRYDHYPITADDMNAHYDALAGEDWFYPMTAMDERGSVAGHMILRFTDEDKTVLRFGFVILDPTLRGQGLGKEMLTLALRMAFEVLKAQTVTLGVFENNPAACACYRAAGFRDAQASAPGQYHVLNEVWPCRELALSLEQYEAQRARPQSALDVILSRRSYRGMYKKDRVPREHLTTILQAGLAAPSGCNKQTTSLVAVDDPAVLSRLLAAIDPPVAATAPALICVLTQRINAYRDRCFATQDYAAAIENMLLAIAALGYQSCWYEGHITDADRIGDRLAQILGVPDGYELVCILPVGVAQDAPRTPPKRPFEERAWFNGMGQPEG